MIRDLELERPADELADVCIVGAGAAGIVLAAELARQGRRVVVLEGGGPEVEERSQEPYRSEVVGLAHNGVHVGRFRASGGSTTRWGGQILELDELDFEQRPWLAGSGWELGKAELQPYYDRAIVLEGLGGATLADREVWQEIGLATPEFAGFESFFSRWCPETNFARLHGQLLRESPLIEVWLHANAVAPVMDGQGPGGVRIAGVRARTLDGAEHVFRARQFVWAMGGIESVRFFLQPELAGMPWQQNGLLGRFWQDHIVVSAAKLKLTDARLFHAAFDNVFSRGYKYQPKIRLLPAEQKAARTLNVAAMIFFRSDADEVGAELKTTAKKLLRGRLKELTGKELARLMRHLPLLARQSWRYARHRRAYVPADAVVELGVHCEQPPEGESRITLNDERDTLGMLRTRVDWRVSDAEIDSIRVCVEQAREALRSLAEVLPDDDLLHDREAFRRRCGDGYHHMGGMRMSASAERGVVDLHLKLHGVENGFVCSAAVFPCSGFSNPTHTVLALAVRLAEYLAEGR